jgi:hypothetical protein
VKVNQGIENSLSGQYESRKKGILEKKRKEKKKAIRRKKQV